MGKAKRSFNPTVAFILLAFLVVIGLILVRTQNASEEVISISTAVGNHPFQLSDPDLATEMAKKLQYTPSQPELSSLATDTVRKYQLITPPPIATSINYSVRSTEDIANVVLNDPFFGDLSQGDFGPCLKADQPGQAFFVRSLQAGWPDYYVIPFFQDGNVCGVYKVVVKDGLGEVAGWRSGFEKQFPPVSVDQARLLVENKTRQIVIGVPELVFKLLRRPVDPLSPFWLVTSADGQSYFVIDRSNPETGKVEIEVVNSLEAETVGP